MASSASQIVSNMKRSFNIFVSSILDCESVNYDDDSFDTSGLDQWYSVRYTGYSTEPPGMGDIIDSKGNAGHYHLLKCVLSAWTRDDIQRISLTGMVDNILTICESHSIMLYDFSDPDDPSEIGSILIKPQNGRFLPDWGSDGGLRTYNASKGFSGIAGFSLEFGLITLTEVN